MTTILLEKNKKELRKEYCFRYITSFIWAIFVSGIILLILELTVFYSIKIEEDALQNQFLGSDQQKRNELVEKYKNKISETKMVVNKFENDEETVLEVINYIFSLKPSSIIIESISVNGQEKGEFVTISGVSSNREDLLSFTKTLDENENVEDFNLPLSSLVKITEIPFSLTFKYGKNE